MDTRVRTAVKPCGNGSKCSSAIWPRPSLSVDRRSARSRRARRSPPRRSPWRWRENCAAGGRSLQPAGDGQVIEAEFVHDAGHGPADARKTRVSLGWVGERWVARLLETDEALARARRRRNRIAVERERPDQGAGPSLRDLESLHRNLLVAGCDPALGCWGVTWRSVSTSSFALDREASRPALEELALGGCTWLGCTFWARVVWRERSRRS